MSAQQGATEIVRRDEGPSAALARQADDWDLGIPVERLVARVDKIREVQSKVMKADHHFGVIPGTGGKPTLLKPGAEILCLTFQLAPEFKTIERWDGEHLECVVTCTLVHSPSGTHVGEGIGSCTTKESKYAYRKGERVCPKCGKAAIIKGKEQFGGGWLCWQKKEGCGAKFGDKDQAIVGQTTERVANPDLPDAYNTVRKMACKRAHVAAVLFVTCASEIFTQDVEDMNGGGRADDGDGGGHDDAAPSNQQRQAPPRDQQRGNGNGGRSGQQAQQRGNGGSSRGGQGQAGQHQQGNPPADASESFLKLAKLIKESETLAALEELVPELQIARDEQTLAIDEYKLLREAYSTRSTELKGTARASA